MHLAEDVTCFEFEPAGDRLVSPLVTGFRRSFQIMARYRMNDLLRLSVKPCACGSPLRSIREVAGRKDDALSFARADGTDIFVSPDIMRNRRLPRIGAQVDGLLPQRHGERRGRQAPKPHCFLP